MVSSKDTKEEGNKEHVETVPLSMVSSKGAGGAIDGFIEGREGGREHHTHSGTCGAFHLRFATEKE